MKARLILFLMAFIAIAASPKWGVWQIEKSNSFLDRRSSIFEEEILFFEPNVLDLEIAKSIDRNYFDRREIVEKMKVSASRSWKKFGINASFIKDNNSLTFKDYSKLLSLKQDMFQANSLQQPELDRSVFKPDKLSQRILPFAPKISFEYSDLVQKTGKKYFGFIGIRGIRYNAKTGPLKSMQREMGLEDKGQFFIYYFILVDIRNSEILYREFKFVPLRLNVKNMKGFMHQSFEIFNENLTS